MKALKEIYEYRSMIQMLVRRDLRGKYKGSVLGFAWTFINPLLQLAVYTMVFSVVMRSGIDRYAIFLFVALIPWLAMANSVTGGAIVHPDRRTTKASNDAAALLLLITSVSSS